MFFFQRFWVGRHARYPNERVEALKKWNFHNMAPFKGLGDYCLITLKEIHMCGWCVSTVSVCLGVCLKSVCVWVCVYSQCVSGCVSTVSVCLGVCLQSVCVWVYQPGCSCWF